MDFFKSKDEAIPAHIQMAQDSAQYEIFKTLEFYENQSQIEQRNYSLPPAEAAYNAFCWAEEIKAIHQLKWLVQSDDTIFRKLIVLWRRSKNSPSFLGYLENFFLIQEQETWKKVLEIYPKKLSGFNLKMMAKIIDDNYYYGE